MHLYQTSLLLAVAAVVTRADNGPPPSTNNSMERLSKPDIQWSILNMDLPARKNLCERQIAYCANNCGGPQEAPKNFCNATSMAWGCGCASKTPDFAPYMWPVVIGECSGQAQACQVACNEMKATEQRPDCSNACTAYYQCGTDKAPPSYLETNSANDEPSYNGKIKAQDNSSKNKQGRQQQESSSSSLLSYFSASTQMLLTVSVVALLSLQQ